MKDVADILEGVTISIDKQIPVGAGLGGGSSDAAATLKGLLRLWQLKFKETELQHLAIKLGADVPFFLSGQASFASGIGDQLTTISLPIDYFIVLVYPNVAVSTAWAYKNINFSLTKTKKSIKLSQILKEKIDKLEWKNFFQNDFEEVVYNKFPKLRDVKQKLYEQGSFYACMSGSGSTLCGMFNFLSEAERVAKAFPSNYQTILARPI